MSSPYATKTDFSGYTVAYEQNEIQFPVYVLLTLGAALLTTNAWNQETDSQLITTVPTGQQRFAYSADSDFEQRVLAFGAGYRGNGPWRFGGGLAFSLMSLRLVQSVSDRLACRGANPVGLQDVAAPMIEVSSSQRPLLVIYSASIDRVVV